MSRSRELDEDTDMAISYASRAPAGPPQTLPSFREVSRNVSSKDDCSQLTKYTHSFSPLTFTMRSTLPRHTTTPVPNRRTAHPPAMKWQPTPDQFPCLHQMPLRSRLMVSILVNTQRARASPHPDRWANIYPCESAIMPHEALVRSSRPSGTSNPSQTGRDTPTAE